MKKVGLGKNDETDGRAIRGGDPKGRPERNA
jgi:hypothetical protein